MTRDMIKMISKNKKEAAKLVRYANPKSRIYLSIDEIKEIMTRNIPYSGNESRPVITDVKITNYIKNDLIKAAYFRVTLENGKIWELSAIQDLKGQTAEEKERDKTASYPSGLFNIFHRQIA
jgi:hypothetical protein